MGGLGNAPNAPRSPAIDTAAMVPAPAVSHVFVLPRIPLNMNLFPYSDSFSPPAGVI
jgi:hypothetical protein